MEGCLAGNGRVSPRFGQVAGLRALRPVQCAHIAHIKKIFFGSSLVKVLIAIFIFYFSVTVTV